MVAIEDPWPATDAELVSLQDRLAQEAEEALRVRAWQAPVRPMIGGCFVAFARGEAGPGRGGDRAWAAAVVWRPPARDVPRRGDDHLRGRPVDGAPRQADDVATQHVVAGTAPSSYRPGFLARREGPLLAASVSGLTPRPEVLLVDATGIDHPRGAGLALHLGAVLDLPTVGVTHRGLAVRHDPPDLGTRGDSAPVVSDGSVIAHWLCTRTGARPVLVHPAWRTGPRDAVDAVLAAATEGARSPVPLQEARRVAREARSLAGAG